MQNRCDAPTPLGLSLGGVQPPKYFFSIFKMARKGRPRKGSPYKWNKERAKALEKKLIERQAKIDSDEVATVCPTKKERDEATRAIARKAVSGMAKNVAVLRELKALNMSLSDMVVAASIKQEETPKDIICQIGESKELQALVKKFDLARVADSDEAKALCKAFPVVDGVMDAIRTCNRKIVERQERKVFVENFLHENRDMPCGAIVHFLNAPSKQMAEEIKAAENQAKSLNPQITMQDIDAVYDILIDADIFAYKPTKEDLLAVIRAEVQKPIKLKKIGLWAYFLDYLFRKNKISGWWQDAYGSAKTFESRKGKPISAKDLSKYLSKNDKGRWDDRDSNIKPKARERMNFYKDIDEALSCL